MLTETQTGNARIAVDRQPPVARISLVNPPLNVIDLAMMEELVEALRAIELDESVCAIVIAGSGKCFSAGVDVSAHTPDKVDEMLTRFHSVMRALLESRKVTIATVHGNCLGGGAELAMMCDFVYTAEPAIWGFPEIKLGCYPPVAVTALAALVGQKRAADLILTGRTISGREAADIGLASGAVPAEQLEQTVAECLNRLSQLSPAALAVAKKATYTWDSMHFEKGLARAEKIYLEELSTMADAQEGIAAFLQKREPRWTGK